MELYRHFFIFTLRASPYFSLSFGYHPVRNANAKANANANANAKVILASIVLQEPP